MPKASPIRDNFNAGEISPLMYGRVDMEKYNNALGVCINGVPYVQGPWMKRSGTMYVADTQTVAETSRLIPFVFSTTQAYILEFGDQYMRVYKDHGQVQDGGGAFELATPYLEADLFQLKFTQKNDVLYIDHNGYAPRKITRTDHDAWTIDEIDFLDGPYLNTNKVTANTFTPSGTSGSVTVTAINNTFASTDVGRLIRFKDAAGNWSWMEITAYTSEKIVTATIRGPDLSATTASANWRLGVWSETTGYPAAPGFYEDRLVHGGGVDTPQRVDFSVTGDYENMEPTDPDGTVTDSHAISVTLNANNVNSIRWIMDDENALLVGTVGGLWSVRPSILGEALTPANKAAKRPENYGSADIQAVKVGSATMYVQNAKRKLRETTYDGQRFSANDMTILADHVTRGSIIEMDYQLEPQPVIWAPRGDGVLLGFTYDRTQAVFGWHRHILGGFSDSAGAVAAKVESVAVIPTPDGTSDELWMIVQRYIDGASTRMIEYLTPFWELDDDQTDAYFVDCGLTYDSTPATVISGLDHLEGETVDILADGAVHPTKVVASGQVTLDYSASVIHIGLHYNGDGQMLRLNSGAADGTAQGKTKRIHRVIFRFYDTLGIQFGPDADHLGTHTFRDGGDNMNEPPPLFNGDTEVEWNDSYNKDGFIYWRSNQPLPCCVQAVMPQMHTQDR